MIIASKIIFIVIKLINYKIIIKKNYLILNKKWRKKTKQINNNFQNNNQKDNKINQNTQYALNLLDLDIPNDEKIKNNNLIFQQSNNDLLKLKGR